MVDDWAKKVKQRGDKVLVVVLPISGNWIHKKFFHSAINVLSPAVVNALANQGIQTTVHISNNFPIDYSRNHSVDTCLKKYLADYIFFMDTDQTFPGDSILRLMETISEENPIVTGMYYKKREPFECVIGRYAGWDEMSTPLKDNLSEMGFVTDAGTQCLFYKGVTFFDRDVPFWVDAFGMGCVLAMKEAFDNLKQPYFKYTRDPRLEDEYLKNSEDMWFCAQVKRAGITVLCDPRVQCGHICEIESNVDLFENVRDTSFEITKNKEPKTYKKIMDSAVDVREEQKELKEYLLRERSKEVACDKKIVCPA